MVEFVEQVISCVLVIVGIVTLVGAVTVGFVLGLRGDMPRRRRCYHPGEFDPRRD